MDNKHTDKNTFPQVLLLGNGLNRSCKNNADWNAIISNIWKNDHISCDKDIVHNTPFPLLAVLATNDELHNTVKENHSLFYGIENIEGIRPLQAQLLDTGFDHILTTNYSYELERTANTKVKPDGKFCSNLMRHTEAIERAEAKYMLHTYNEIEFNGKQNKIWHIHGEARKPTSIVLGHYWYGCLLYKYQEILKKRRNMYQKNERDNKPPKIDSWLDAFITGDVHVLGFSFDLSEMDLWWLLNRKKRENATCGKLYFYSPKEAGDEVKTALLEGYGAVVNRCGFNKQQDNYTDFYNEAITDIQKRVRDKNSN